MSNSTAESQRLRLPSIIFTVFNFVLALIYKKYNHLLLNIRILKTDVLYNKKFLHCVVVLGQYCIRTEMFKISIMLLFLLFVLVC